MSNEIMAVGMGGGTFRIPILFHGWRRFVDPARRGAGRRLELTYVSK